MCKMCENLVQIASTIDNVQCTKYLKPLFLNKIGNEPDQVTIFVYFFANFLHIINIINGEPMHIV